MSQTIERTYVTQNPARPIILMHGRCATAEEFVGISVDFSNSAQGVTMAESAVELTRKNKYKENDEPDSNYRPLHMKSTGCEGFGGQVLNLE